MKATVLGSVLLTSRVFFFVINQQSTFLNMKKKVTRCWTLIWKLEFYLSKYQSLRIVFSANYWILT